MKGLVSIIIPAYNAEKYIAETIASVLQQTYSNWELIIIDDGSTDQTGRIVQTYLSDEKIHYIRQENRGVSAARNRGIELAKGEFLAFLDADDVWLSENIEKKIFILENNNEIDWVFSDMLLIDACGKPFDSSAPSGKGHNLLDSILLWDGAVVPGPSSNIVIKANCIANDIRFDETLSTAADQDFCITLAAQFHSFHIPQTLWQYRILPDSMSRNIKLMESDHIKVYHKAHMNGLFHSRQFRRKCFSNLYLIIAGSWWVNEKNYFRGVLFLSKALILYPQNIIKLLRKLLH